ncbi:MAG: twin-arginine translocase subunit TatB [Alphaproteobacteria bacterium]|nr:twin-arginine translocase subunit TatB [Alphaproteobacteria bacterium]
MFDIGAMELFVVAVLALVVVGPKDLPRLLRTVGGFVRKIRELASEFKDGVEELAAEADRQTDPFADLRKKEGLRPGMSPEEITNHIMANRDKEASEEQGDRPADASKGDRPSGGDAA